MKEKMQILNMIEEGKINAEEGSELLKALESNEENIEYNLSNLNIPENLKNKWLKINVYTPETETDDETRVNVKIPLSLINIGLKFSSKFSSEFQTAGLSEKDINDIIEAINDGMDGTIIDVDSGDTKVEVIVE